MSSNLNPIENVWKLLKMNLAKRKSSNLQGISFSDKKRMEEFSKGFNNQSCKKYGKSYF